MVLVIIGEGMWVVLLKAGAINACPLDFFLTIILLILNCELCGTI